jgi:P4 family phage/plasmid primase-like protien
VDIHDIIARTSSVPKIPVPDPSYAVENIVVGLKECGLLFFDNTQPLIKLPLCYRRISVDQAETLIFNLLDEQAQIAVSNVQIREAMKRIRFIPSLQIDLKAQFWKSQMFINLTSGIYDIIKQETVPLRNELVFDYCIRIRYIPNSKLDDAPVFRHFVETSVGMEQLECLLRVLGYSISSLTKGRKAFVFYGIGRTGKSTILNVLEAVIGEGLVSHEPFHTMSGERAKAHYEGKRINISRETSTKVNKQEESFKSLISCEYTTGSEKFEKQRDFIATLSFVFAGNSDIDFAVMDDAILDRLVYLMFTKEIPEEAIDLELEEKLMAEKDIIFSMALDALNRLIKDKYDFHMGDQY